MERKPFEQRFNSLKLAASSWLPIWRDIRDNINPMAGMFSGEKPGDARAIDHRVILDGTPIRAAEDFASGLSAHLTSPSRPWWKPTLDDPDLSEYEPVKIWLSDLERRMYAIQHGSNIHNVLNVDYGEYGSFATSAMALLEDRQDLMRGRNYTIGEYYVGAGADGRINAFAYEYHRTVGQLVEQYGLKKVSHNVKRQWEKKNLDTWIKCLLVVMPNPERDTTKLDNQNMEYSMAAWEEGTSDGSFLDLSGFQEFPFIVSRYKIRGQSVWGVGSPGWTAKGDAKMLQKMQRDRLIQIEKVGDPPMQADATADGNVVTLPGGLTRTSSLSRDQGVRPAYQIAPDLTGLLETIRETRQAVNEAHFKNLFLLLSQDEAAGRTKHEIVERNSERLTMLGPLVERLYTEKLAPLIRRQFSMMWRAGQIPPPPPEIDGRAINIELISVLAQAQKAVGTRAIDETLAFVGEVAKTIPEAIDNVDADEAIRARSKMVGVPPRIIVSPDVLAKKRKARAEAAQQMAQVDDMERMANIAKTASETKLGDDSALDAVVPRQVRGTR